MPIVVTCEDSKKKISAVEINRDGTKCFVGGIDAEVLIMASGLTPKIATVNDNIYDNGYASGNDETRFQSVYEFPCLMSSPYVLNGFVFYCPNVGVKLKISAKSAISGRPILIDADEITTVEDRNEVKLNNNHLFKEGDEVIFRAEFSEPVTLDGSIIDNSVLTEIYGSSIFVPFFENVMRDVYIRPIPTESEMTALTARVAALEKA